MGAPSVTCLVGFITLQTATSSLGQPVISQSPEAIALMKLNSTAEIRCHSTLNDPMGLSLKKHYSKDKDVLYLAIPSNKQTVHKRYAGRISVTGQCCDFTLQLTQLIVEDTDSYYCQWSYIDKGSLLTPQSNSTIIIIRAKNPNEECWKTGPTIQLLFIVCLCAAVIVTTLFIGVITVCCLHVKESITTKLNNATNRTNRRRLRFFSERSDQQHIFPSGQY